MPDLTLTLVQSALVWENRKANLDRFGEHEVYATGRGQLTVTLNGFRLTDSNAIQYG